MPTKHAILSASSSKIWLNCSPSVRFSEEFEDTTSVYAEEGTSAHSLCEYHLKKALGLPAELEELKYHDQEMEDCANQYAAYVIEAVEDIKKLDNNPQIFIEQQLDFSNYVPEGFGTGDCVVVGGNTIHVIDFKYGKGVPVDATWNTQMMLYAIGALNLCEVLYDIEIIKMTIFQPRIGNISEFEMSKDELINWAENTLKPKALLAFDGEGEFKAGEHCRFCKGKAACKERARENLKIAKYEFKEPNKLSSCEISSILKQAEAITTWLDDVKSYALSEALKGTKIPGFKVVSGRSNRKFDNEEEVASILSDLGIDPYEKKLKSLTYLEKKLGKIKFDDALASHVVKPEGKPTLVEESDSRPDYNSLYLLLGD